MQPNWQNSFNQLVYLRIFVVLLIMGLVHEIVELDLKVLGSDGGLQHIRKLVV